MAIKMVKLVAATVIVLVVITVEVAIVAIEGLIMTGNVVQNMINVTVMMAVVAMTLSESKNALIRTCTRKARVLKLRRLDLLSVIKETKVLRELMIVSSLFNFLKILILLWILL